MRPTVIRLIAGGALGVAFSISLTLPGSVVFPEEAPITHLAAPETPTPKVVRAARMVERPAKASPNTRVVVQRVYAPTPGPMRATSVVRQTAPRSKPSRKPAKHAPTRVVQPVTPLAAAKAPPVAQPADEPKQANEQGDDEPRKAHRQRKSERPKKADKPRKSAKPKKAKKPKDHGSAKKDKPSGARDEDRDQQGDDRGGHENGEHGHGRGGRGDHG
jgi:hypothetical protein